MLTKEKARKRHPTAPSAFSGLLALLVVSGTLKNSPLTAVQTASASFPANNCDAQRGRMGKLFRFKAELIRWRTHLFQMKKSKLSKKQFSAYLRLKPGR
jgi:hypothetical protein